MNWYESLPNADRPRYLPRYPIYIPTHGRFLGAAALTIRCLEKWNVPFLAVCQPSEEREYNEIVRKGGLLVLPGEFSEMGEGATPARNWIKDHATRAGAERHWLLDDNIREFRRFFKNERLLCPPGSALRVVEDFTDRYSNVGLSGPNYQMFGITAKDPFTLNAHVYSAILMDTSLPFRWRGPMNEDTDMCLQVLASGLCTILVNAFLADKMRTLTMKGGYNGLYQGDGRLKMAKTLERRWPRVVTTERRYERPQHVVRGQWRYFDTQLRLKPDFDPNSLPKVDEYDLTLKSIRPTGERSERLHGKLGMTN